MDDLDGWIEVVQWSLVVLLIAVGYFWGKLNERKHLAQLDRRERELSDVLVFATRYPEASATPQDPVLVHGAVVVSADAFRMFVAGLRKLVGGRFHAFEGLVERARREAVVRLKQAAKEQGCSMVFNMRIETTRILGGNRGGSTAVEVMAYGTGMLEGVGSVAASPAHYRFGPELSSDEGFDLWKNPASKRAVIGWFVTVVLCFALPVVTAYTYVDAPPIGIFALIALAVAVRMGWGLAHSRVPVGESVVLGMLWGVTMWIVAFYAALLVNTWTDFSPAQEVVFRLQADQSLVSTDPELPRLEFPEDRDYWVHQEVDSEHTFVVRKGWLGFWQVADEPYYGRLRAFYRKQELQERLGWE